MARGDIRLRFTWQAWQLRHWAGSGGAPGSQLTPWTSRLFAWQAWHLRGLWWRTGFSADAVDAAPLCVAGVALGDRRGTWRFTWQAWRFAALGGLWWRTGFSADAVDAAALCVAGVAGVALFIAQRLPFLNIMFCGKNVHAADT